MSPKEIHRRILLWYGTHKRDLPWRRSQEPYRIWISEIMLQQTRVEAVIPYYERFLSHFPDLKGLAEAETDRLLNLWAGLGYYSRARNLQAAARQVMESYEGEFPRSLEDLRTLKGIGAYTAAAIASIAFGQKAAAIDGNLERVFSRLLASRKDPKREGKKDIEALGAELVSHGEAGSLNQAFMDLSSAVCLPKNPRCGECPLESLCGAKKQGLESEIPARRPKAPPVELQARGVVLLAEGKLLLARRPEGQWLSGMWDIPWWIEGSGTEFRAPRGSEQIAACLQKRTITKHKIYFQVQGLRCDSLPRTEEIGIPASEFRWVPLEELHGLNLPRPSEMALEKVLAGLPS